MIGETGSDSVRGEQSDFVRSGLKQTLPLLIERVINVLDASELNNTHIHPHSYTNHYK